MKLTARRARQPRSVTLVYGGVAAALLLVIAAVALIVAPPAPPSIAEYAPQATERIDEALKAQSSKFGQGDGGSCAAGQECIDVGGSEGGDDPAEATTTTGRRQVDVNRVRRCVGNPPRQTEDPQSPPCVNYWEGDNGGSTWRGVTRDQIVVAFASATTTHTWDVYKAFFEKRFELYGRELRFVRLNYDCYVSCSDQTQHAIAEEMDAVGAFAGFVSVPTSSSRAVLQRDLARRGIIGIGGINSGDGELLRQSHPYLWGYGLAVDDYGARLADLACKWLKDRPARHGGPDVAGKTRKFHILTTPTGTAHHSIATGMRACGIEVGVTELTGNEESLMADLKAQNVTTLITTLGVAATSAEMTNASTEGFQPEWVSAGRPEHEPEVIWARAPAEQRAHLLAQATWNKGQPRQDSPWYWALSETGETGRANQTTDGALADVYHAMLLLASGIQAAGPNLTPHTFAAKLQALEFPNPGAAAAPYYQATVGFTGDHTMIDDTALAWWSETARGYSTRASEVGSWCYVGQGIRWRRYPSEPTHQFQQMPCT